MQRPELQGLEVGLGGLPSQPVYTYVWWSWGPGVRLTWGFQAGILFGLHGHDGAGQPRAPGALPYEVPRAAGRQVCGARSTGAGQGGPGVEG